MEDENVLNIVEDKNVLNIIEDENKEIEDEQFFDIPEIISKPLSIINPIKFPEENENPLEGILSDIPPDLSAQFDNKKENLMVKKEKKKSILNNTFGFVTNGFDSKWDSVDSIPNTLVDNNVGTIVNSQEFDVILIFWLKFNSNFKSVFNDNIFNKLSIV